MAVRSVADLNLVALAFRLVGADQISIPEVRPLRIARCRTPFWNKIEPAGEAALEVACERLSKAGATGQDVNLPSQFDGLEDAQNIIMMSGGRVSFLDGVLEFGERFHQDFHDQVNNKLGITPEELTAAWDLAADCRKSFDAGFREFDVVLTPASTGEAPEGYRNGDMVFNMMWTLLHVHASASLVLPAQTGSQLACSSLAPDVEMAVFLQLVKRSRV